ncbi:MULTISPECIES: ProQ/FinO family protein [Pseudomonas]|uniref:ProQ activator of osmoprotectant transporter prop n=2 Tax=Pseudomonas oryzihabitans TaxID=47885 RepID=A0A0U4WS76_9PSED|nr:MULTISPECIES: ProQ/FinO family protein [Pseudomonas]HAC67056.1 ProQ activator of osmoprotectant transporter prop [Pseudomonas sp.]ALZ84973.1 ProQ activator of osmoprotectant transporter prop [Pseudomonas oryzihabitans]NRH41440.1 ProQ activator of osmoprotectant transporter prop [Pseudomonas sp. MS15a(2019)]WCE09774.1 ProQ/FinO family protein [Pseudomonas sp. JBR1]SEO89129.1 ProP effector [Pseudomonas sp. Snoq117.2]
MGFEQLAELRDRLRAEKAQVTTESKERPARRPSPKAKPREQKPREQDPVVEGIRRLQKHFPLAFPVNPAPKVPLKEGILKDAEQHLERLGITGDQLKQAIATWCRGTRYWAAMTEDAPRLDLNGQPAGSVTASQAVYAKQQARRQRAQARREQAKAKAETASPAEPEATEPVAAPADGESA